MAEKQFSWITESTLETTEVLPQEEIYNTKISNFKEKFLTHKKALIFIFSLLAILFILKITQEEKVITAPQVEGMIAVLPIRKGQIIEGMLLKPVSVLNSQLSKAQRLLLLRPDDAEKIMGKLRAKKDIPSQKPIFWNELELIPDEKLRVKPLIPVVTYPEN